MNLFESINQINSQQLFNNPFSNTLASTNLTSQTIEIIYNFIKFFHFEFIVVFVTSILYVIFIMSKFLTITSNYISMNINSFKILKNNSLGNFNDISLLTTLLIVFLISHFYNVFSQIEVFYNSFLIWILVLLISLIVLIPFYILKNYGSYYLAFLRGGGSKKSIFVEFFNDIMGIFSFFMRINIQLIRLLIATIFFAIMVEYWETSGSFLYNSQLNIETITFFDYCVYTSSLVWFVLLRLLYEVGHFWLLFFIQTTAFSMIIIMLVQFLYICYLVDKLEMYFKKNTK